MLVAVSSLWSRSEGDEPEFKDMFAAWQIVLDGFVLHHREVKEGALIGGIGALAFIHQPEVGGYFGQETHVAETPYPRCSSSTSRAR